MMKRIIIVFIFATALSIGARGGPNWAGWRGPDSQGVSSEKGLPTEWSDTKNIKWKTPIEGIGHSSPIVWGNRIFLTTSLEGAVVAGAKAVTHYFDGQEFKHPDATGGDRIYTLKVLCVDAVTGRLLWEKTAYEGTAYDSRHRKGSYAASTPATDGRYIYAYFGSEGVYCYDFTGKQ
ncbi:MAG TPA: PQQ-binding-like beta-propeller repeat protein, partial [Blastocatellia bacterium]